MGLAPSTIGSAADGPPPTARAWRDFALEVEREEVIWAVSETGIPAANAALRALDARRGRLRPKLYRPLGRRS